MNNNKEKIEASILLASYLETVGFKNGHWEFNYQIKITDLQTYIRVWNTMLHHFLILGGTENINIENWNSSDDTIMIMATLEAIINGGGLENYEKKYLEYYDLILDEKRASGSTTISSLELLKRKKELKVDVLMGGNGAAMRTGPIGLKWYKNYDKVIEESLIASKITHNYYIGYFGGIVTALFTESPTETPT
jgi:ADP-ribosylarginine hydrolase